MGMFLYNIGVRTPAAPKATQPVQRAQRRWRYIPEERATAILREGTLNSRDPDLSWIHFQTKFDMAELERRVLAEAERYNENYIGVTSDLMWRFKDCTEHSETDMTAHFDRGFTTMFALSANYGANICHIEEYLIDTVQESRYRMRNRNSRTYRQGPIRESSIYFLYMVVNKSFCPF